MDDSELLEAYLDRRSEAAFAKLVNRYLSLTYSAAMRRLGDAHLAKDAVQMVFVELARKAATLRDRKVLAGWLYTSTYYKAVQIVRAESRRKLRENAAELMNEASRETTDDWSRLRPVIDEVMLDLKESDREVLLLRFFEGNRFPEIAEKLSLEENTARMRVERALEKMHALLARRGVKSTTAALSLVIAQQAAGAVPAGLASEVTGAVLAHATASAGGLAHVFSSAKAAFAVSGSAMLAAGGFLFFQLQTSQQLLGQVDELHREIHRTATATMAARENFSAASGSAASYSQSPAYHRMMLRGRSTLTQRYAPLLRTLHLDPEKESRFETLLLDQFLDEQIALADLSAGIIPGASAEDARAVEALKAEVAKNSEREIHQLLGDALFARYSEVMRTLAVRSEIDGTATVLRHVSVALRDDEIEGLAVFVARSGNDVLRPLSDSLMKEAGTLSENQRAALAQLQAVRIARYQILLANREAAARGLIRLPHVPGSKLTGTNAKP